MKILLCIPPQYDYHFPPLGTPAILSFLKSKGIDAAQTDLNISYRDFLTNKISGAELKPADKKDLFAPLLKLFFQRKLKRRYYSNCLPRVSDQVSPDLPYNNNTNSSFYFTERLLSSRYLFRYLADEKENTFYQFYQNRGITDRFKKEHVSVLGISVISPTQAVAALTLGLLVKKVLPHIHVTLGGQWVTLFRDELRKRDDLFACFDSLVVFEGEEPLYELVKALTAAKAVATDLPVLTNVITARNRHPPLNPKGHDFKGAACPDFSGLPLKKYSGYHKGAALTYETSRGCYWGKCAYCVDLPLPKPAYRTKRAAIVAQEIKELIRRYNAHYLLMGDPGMAPRQMMEISRKLIRQKVKIRWWTMARLDPGFNKKIFTVARRAGLEKINFGFESANDIVCAGVHKGNLNAVSQRVIRDCAESGIQADLQTMLGLPHESHQQAFDTVDFLLRNKRDIAATTFNVFYLTPGNHVYYNPGRYGILYDKRRVLPFQFFIPFKNPKGMTPRQAQSLVRVYYQLLARSSAPAAPVKKPAKKSLKSVRRVHFLLCGDTLRVTCKRYASGNIILG
jgi:anaerobic magnesium-protoporphyrin IX monomethyl ester cyclase